MRPIRLLFAFLCVLAVPGFAAAFSLFGSDPADRIVIPTSTGERQAFARLVPGGGARPTIVLLHGRLASARRAMAKYDFDEVALKNGYNIVFADGIKRRWQDGRVEGPLAAIDDVAFLKDLAKTLVDKKIARKGELYLVGISNGGMMAYRMACEAPGVYAALGTVIANMPEGLANCPLSATPLIAINGVSDPIVPFKGGIVARLKKQGRVIGVPATLERFARANGCSALATERLPDRRRKDGLSILRHQGRQCRNGAVVSYDIVGAGHAVPGRDSFPVHFFGQTSSEISAAQLMANFFGQLAGR